MFLHQDNNPLSFINWQWQVAKDIDIDETKQLSCALKILPIAIFLSHTLRSKIIAPWDMSQYQIFPRILLETSVFYLHFHVRFFLAMLWTSRLDTAAEETWVRLMYNTYPIPTETPRLNLLSWSTNPTAKWN